ncbi:ribosomal RNA small subunit methyltransferase A [Candidatus Uhrbacteria bacterium]|nr:ribosomal RNA small subunit methyltransferase A [Candidatus Uhrbacteria bacterium]
MKPSEIKAALASFGGRPNKRLGQNFLIDKNILQTIVETADIQKEERVLEIGPGLGVLTRELIDRGAIVTAIEQDRHLVEYLKKLSVPVVHGDAAKLDWMEFVAGQSWKLIANLPYSITSLALRKALWSTHPPIKLVVLVQREVAERVIAKDGKTSLLSLMVGLASHKARIIKRVPAGAFYPPPKVESAILEIIPKQIDAQAEQIMALAKKGFAHPRKLLSSNLGLTDGSVFEKLGLNPKVRAEDLSVDAWINLCQCFVRS